MIVLGGSLGSMLAAQSVLGALPADFPAPLVLALHRPPDEQDMLSPLLRRVCKLPVAEVIDKDPIEPGRVYIAPADYHVLVETDCLSLSIDERVNYARPSIDVLFESAALAHGRTVIGVILTGAGNDGARGAALIERRGGTVLIEDPTTAHRADLPVAARAATQRATIARLEHIAVILCELTHRK